MHFFPSVYDWSVRADGRAMCKRCEYSAVRSDGIFAFGNRVRSLSCRRVAELPCIPGVSLIENPRRRRSRRRQSIFMRRDRLDGNFTRALSPVLPVSLGLVSFVSSFSCFSGISPCPALVTGALLSAVFRSAGSAHTVIRARCGNPTERARHCRDSAPNGEAL